MSKPERQHFIPRSYLNNFAVSSDDKYFIHGKRQGSDKIVSLSTKDICVDKNLYTIPTTEEDKKFDIEHFYADKVDSVFPEVYSILKNRNITTIDFETRLKIITTALSLYFRTPKFLNIQNQLFENVINKTFGTTDEEEITVSFLGEELTIKRNEAKQIIKERKEHNRIKFLFQHLQSYEKFVQSKLLDNMAVYHINDDSDNNEGIIRNERTTLSFKTFALYKKNGDIFVPLEIENICRKYPNFEDEFFGYKLKFFSLLENAVIAAFSMETYRRAILRRDFKYQTNDLSLDIFMNFDNEPQVWLDDKYGINHPIAIYFPDGQETINSVIQTKEVYEKLYAMDILQIFKKI